jgi:hypothetical protein
MEQKSEEMIARGSSLQADEITKEGKASHHEHDDIEEKVY